MKKIILLIALLYVGACATSARPKVQIKLMSYNIRFMHAKDSGEHVWEVRKEASVNMIRREQPDVIGLQEPELPQVKYLASRLPEYAHVEQDREDGLRENGQYLMIMWLREKYDLLDSGHFWLSPTPDTVSFGWDGHCRRVTVWVKLRDRASGREFHYFNTHLDHRGNQAREKGAALNVEQMQRIAGRSATVFLSGDMNSQRGTPTGAFLVPYDAWMKSARETAPASDQRATFDGFGLTQPRWLDHIFYRRAKAVKYETLDGHDYGVRYISDHYPVVCSFIF